MNVYEIKTKILRDGLKDDFFMKYETRINGFSFIGKKEQAAGLTVIVSVDKELDDKHWLHVSMSRKNRIPTYTDMCLVKDIFIGTDKKAIQVFPKEREKVNLMEYCLHLFHCLEGDVLPDFTRGSGTL